MLRYSLRARASGGHVQTSELVVGMAWLVRAGVSNVWVHVLRGGKSGVLL